MTHIRASTLMLLAAMVACAAPKEIPNPARPGSGQPFLAIGPDGKVYLSWVEPLAAGRSRMPFAVLEDAGWRLLGTVSEGPNWFVNWADYPTLLPLTGGVFAAHWLEKRSSSKYSYGIKLALSLAGGSSWKTVFAPEVEQEGQYTGFVSLSALPKGLGAAYLGPAPDGGEHEKALRFVRFAPDGGVLSDEVIDPDVCTCCQTSTALTENGPIVAYRDHESGEIRDISVVVLKDGRWSRPRPVHRDGWRINACPVNGPALAASANRVAVAWYSGADEKPRVFVAFSGDAGVSFTKPAVLDSGTPLGRVGLVLLADGGAVVSWITKTSAGVGDLMIRRVSADSRLGATHRVSAVDTARRTGFPKMVLYDGRLILAWTADRVRTVEVPVPALALDGRTLTGAN